MNIKNLNLTQQQAEKHAIFKPFVDEKLAPLANDFDQRKYLPADLVLVGYLAC